MNQPQLIPAEMVRQVNRPEPKRPDMYIIIAWMRGSWYLPRFAERWYGSEESAMSAANAFARDDDSPYDFFRVVKIPGGSP